MQAHQPYNEEEIIFRLQQGDVQAFDQLYYKYSKAVYNNALKLTRDAAAAEDIVQEVFTSLWEKRKSIDDQRSVSGWLFVLSYNRAINLLKKKLTEEKAKLKMPAQDTEEEWSGLQDLQMDILEKAIAGLSPQKRRVFELCKLKGKSYEETAAELHISKHTVKEYLAGAMASIKEYIHEHPEYIVAFSTSLFINAIFSS